MKKCDIIVPIYNAYEATKECITSVLKNTNLKDNNLVLINDCSTDKNISILLKKFKQDNDNLNIIIIENEINSGFVKTVNIGMKYSNNDVLLLNSDTEVSENWLDKIKKCAYSGEKIATVTPLSNNATLASVPNGLEKNEILSGMNLNSYDKLIEKISYCDFPEIPTAHGFCMYIKRDVLELVGYFDENSFDKGYGEENDFSFRCLEYGYRNLLCDNTIVYHKESQSFNNERKKVIEKHTKILENRYPVYEYRLKNWCTSFPIFYIGENILYQVNVPKKPNILILIHDFDSTTGGTTLHVLDLILKLKDKYNFHVLAPSNGIYKLTSYFDDEVKYKYFSISNTFNIYPKYNKEYKNMLDKIVQSLNITTIHVHHMIGHFFDIIDIIKKYNLNSIITLHDYYCICPTINLLYENQNYCNTGENFNCKNCLQKCININENIIPEWRKDFNNFLHSFNTIITPSEDTKKRILKVYSDLNITVVEHGIDCVKSNYIPNVNNRNIASIGVVSLHKGGQVLEKLKVKLKSKTINLHVFGTSELKNLLNNDKNYKYHGKYEREKLPLLLKKNNISLICFFPIWPETYSYTLTEAIASGIPVLTFDLGAGAERVKKYNLGWTINENSTTEEILEKINKIFYDISEYEKVIDSIKSYKIKTKEKMCSEYNKFYNKNNNKEVDINLLKNFVKINNNDIVKINNNQLEMILNSTKWKIINRIKVPKTIQKIIKKFIRKRDGLK